MLHWESEIPSFLAFISSLVSFYNQRIVKVLCSCKCGSGIINYVPTCTSAVVRGTELRRCSCSWKLHDILTSFNSSNTLCVLLIGNLKMSTVTCLTASYFVERWLAGLVDSPGVWQSSEFGLRFALHLFPRWYICHKTAVAPWVLWTIELKTVFLLYPITLSEMVRDIHNQWTWNKCSHSVE